METCTQGEEEATLIIEGAVTRMSERSRPIMANLGLARGGGIAYGPAKSRRPRAGCRRQTELAQRAMALKSGRKPDLAALRAWVTSRGQRVRRAGVEPGNDAWELGVQARQALGRGRRKGEAVAQ